MYGVVEVQGHQYMVEPGHILDVEKMNLEVGKEVELDKVLFIGGPTPLVGLPTVSGAKVKAKVIRQDKSPKVVIVKRKNGKWEKKTGHRQPYTSLLVTSVEDGKGNVAKIDPKSKRAEKYLK